MRIGIVGVPYPTGGGLLTRALETFLRATNFEIVRFDDYYLGPHTRSQQTVQRLLYSWRVKSRYRAWLKQKEFDGLISAIRQAHCDVLVAVEQGEILLRDLGGTRKIFYANAPTAHETYFGMARSLRPFEINDYHHALEKEIAYYKASDSVIFCWNTHVEYLKKWIYQGNNVVLHPGLGWYGCEPQARRAQHSYPPLIAYTGLVTAYWNNAELLGTLVKKLPYAINFYGGYPIPKEYGLRYQGYAPTMDVLCDYQFGLHTATKDMLRRYGFASKLMVYLSYGLPSLSPEWQLVSHQLEGVVPFNEDNFAKIVEDAIEPARWKQLSDAGYEQAQQLVWSKVLRPLLDLF